MGKREAGMARRTPPAPQRIGTKARVEPAKILTAAAMSAARRQVFFFVRILIVIAQPSAGWRAGILPAPVLWRSRRRAGLPGLPRGLPRVAASRGAPFSLPFCDPARRYRPPA